MLAALAPQKTTYDKYEYMIPMRDGTKLYTSVYVPKDKPGDHPIMLERTPYSAGPYGEKNQRRGHDGSRKFADAGYIFAYQDVRGIHMSQGEFSDLRPRLQLVSSPKDTDETTDAYDTIDYLVKNVPHNNGRVGVWGISYPGGYAAMAAIDSHPALKAVSPQAPTTDWFIGDDDHHHGALFLQDALEFESWMGGHKSEVPGFDPLFEVDRKGDAYKFYLELGPLKNANGPKFFNNRSRYWNDLVRHNTYDEFWQAREVSHTMLGVKCPVLTVGGWFDAEDMYGALKIYAATKKQNKNWNSLVMGPWSHGAWGNPNFRALGGVSFGSMPSKYFQDEVEFPFFDACLRGNGKPELPGAVVFETGRNEWHKLASWPPATKAKSYFMADGRTLATAPSGGSDSYASDPANPVPYQDGKLGGRSTSYMIADQRFASARPDVLAYSGPVLDKDLTWAGPIKADLWVTLSTTDADFVVKTIDVDPSGKQQLVRAEVFRGKFRDSYVTPKPFKPGEPTLVSVPLNDVYHTFLKGHRVMVQVQSSWFPLVDRNPQTFTDIFTCDETAFVKSTVTVLHDAAHPSKLVVGEL
jgi:putative CocE/NonD family hydrolase